MKIAKICYRSSTWEFTVIRNLYFPNNSFVKSIKSIWWKRICFAISSSHSLYGYIGKYKFPRIRYPFLRVYNRMVMEEGDMGNQRRWRSKSLPSPPPLTCDIKRYNVCKAFTRELFPPSSPFLHQTQHTRPRRKIKLCAENRVLLRKKNGVTSRILWYILLSSSFFFCPAFHPLPKFPFC